VNKTEQRRERRGEVEHRKEQREWERPSTSSSNETKLSLCLSLCEPYQEGIDPTVGREEEEKRESDEMIKRERENAKWSLHLILSIDLSSCCQQLRDQSHSTINTSEVKGSPSMLNTNEMITTLIPSLLTFV
jgi:hypothetical protein